VTVEIIVQPVPVKTLLEAGCHFGSRASRWNPKMKAYIFGKRNLIHIINLKETLRNLIRAQHFLMKLSGEGHPVLIVGTKRAAQNVVITEARRAAMPFVSERWLGGTLTNFQTVRSRLRRLEELESMEKEGSLYQNSKKMISALLREKRKIHRNLDGIRTLGKLPGAVIIVDPKREYNAVREAQKLGIPVVAILDTDCDPEDIDIPIPANDDAMRSIQVLLTALVDAIVEGGSTYRHYQAEQEKLREEDAARKAEADRRIKEAQKKRAEEREALKRAQEQLRREREAKAGAERQAPAGGESAGTSPAPDAVTPPVPPATPTAVDPGAGS
jgi:small subunit ribosomal protein S2